MQKRLRNYPRAFPQRDEQWYYEAACWSVGGWWLGSEEVGVKTGCRFGWAFVAVCGERSGAASTVLVA
jgi:hypothetical protein